MVNNDTYLHSDIDGLSSPYYVLCWDYRFAYCRMGCSEGDDFSYLWNAFSIYRKIKYGLMISKYCAFFLQSWKINVARRLSFETLLSQIICLEEVYSEILFFCEVRLLPIEIFATIIVINRGLSADLKNFKVQRKSNANLIFRIYPIAIIFTPNGSFEKFQLLKVFPHWSDTAYMVPYQYMIFWLTSYGQVWHWTHQVSINLDVY